MTKVPHTAYPLAADVPGEQRPEPVPPSIPRSNSWWSAFRRLNGKRAYISTTNRITSGDELKRRNGLGGNALDFRLIRYQYQPPARPATLV